jgi:uncharacterized OB-fold protein
MIVTVCESCGRAAFPARALCPRCGSSSWREEPAGPGVVEEITRTADAVIASVRLDKGPLVVARVAEGAGPGDRLDLSG